ncbi:unnamed protein product [Linum trigynum]|uniref:Uncharacterized protein n=1 Tax=Linum trigynum TaxID=586398 RepID=A0AAV2FVT0_9ROSI
MDFEAANEPPPCFVGSNWSEPILDNVGTWLQAELGELGLELWTDLVFVRDRNGPSLSTPWACTCISNLAFNFALTCLEVGLG